MRALLLCVASVFMASSLSIVEFFSGFRLSDANLLLEVEWWTIELNFDQN